MGVEWTALLDILGRGGWLIATSLKESRSSSVGIVVRSSGRTSAESRFDYRQHKTCFSSVNLQKGWRVHLNCWTKHVGSALHKGKAGGTWSWPVTSSGAEGMNIRNCTFMAPADAFNCTFCHEDRGEVVVRNLAVKWVQCRAFACLLLLQVL